MDRVAGIRRCPILLSKYLRFSVSVSVCVIYDLSRILPVPMHIYCMCINALYYMYLQFEWLCTCHIEVAIPVIVKQNNTRAHTRMREQAHTETTQMSRTQLSSNAQDVNSGS